MRIYLLFTVLFLAAFALSREDRPVEPKVEPAPTILPLAAATLESAPNHEAWLKQLEYDVALLNQNLLAISERVASLESAPPAKSTAQQPAWLTDPTAAEAEAKRFNKPLLIACSTDGCAPCVTVERAVYEHLPTMQAVAARALACRTHVGEDGSCGRFRVHQFPLCLVVDPSGAWSMFTPPANPSEFLVRLDKAVQEANVKGKQK